MGLFDFIYKLSLIATLGVLIWYTYETSRIRKINAQQKDLQLLPALMFYIRHRSGSDRLYIRNIGFGSATTVNVLHSSFLVGGVDFEFRFHLTDSNNTLEPGEEREVGVNFYKGGTAQRTNLDNFMAYHNPELLSQVDAAGEAGLVNDIETPSQRSITVHFHDITGQQYETVIHFSTEGISIIKAPGRI